RRRFSSRILTVCGRRATSPNPWSASQSKRYAATGPSAASISVRAPARSLFMVGTPLVGRSSIPSSQTTWWPSSSLEPAHAGGCDRACVRLDLVDPLVAQRLDRALVRESGLSANARLSLPLELPLGLRDQRRHGSGLAVLVDRHEDQVRA